MRTRINTKCFWLILRTCIKTTIKATHIMDLKISDTYYERLYLLIGTTKSKKRNVVGLLILRAFQWHLDCMIWWCPSKDTLILLCRHQNLSVRVEKSMYLLKDITKSCNQGVIGKLEGWAIQRYLAFSIWWFLSKDTAFHNMCR